MTRIEEIASDPLIRDYVDRGMMKWQGMYLSEHTTALADERYKDDFRLKKHNPMTKQKIYKLLEFAFMKRKKISIQINFKDVDGNIFNYIEGRIVGFGDYSVWLDNKESVSIEEIEYIKLY